MFRDGATVQPARLVRALRAAALAAGVALHERTRVTRIGDGDGRDCARAACGRAEVVVATNAWMTGWRPLVAPLTPFGSYVVLTEPVPELLAEIGWTGGEAITDGRMFLHYFRTTEDGRVLMGSGSGPIGFRGRIDERFSDDAATVARAEAGLRRLLPGLAAAKVEHAWGGPIDVSADQLPVLRDRARHADPLRRRLLGQRRRPELARRPDPRVARARRSDDEWSRLPLVDRRIRPLPPEPIDFLGGSLVRTALLAVEEAEEAGRKPSAPARSSPRCRSASACASGRASRRGHAALLALTWYRHVTRAWHQNAIATRRQDEPSRKRRLAGALVV